MTRLATTIGSPRFTPEPTPRHDPEPEDALGRRWTEWQDKGRIQDARIHRRIVAFGVLVIVVGAGVVLTRILVA